MKKRARKLTKRERDVVRRTIAEEMGKFPQKQAVAVGISRARAIVEKERVAALVRKYT